MCLTSYTDSLDVVLDLVEVSLLRGKADGIIIVSLNREKISFADYVVIATGYSSRQINVIAENLSRRLKVLGLHVTTEGVYACDWVLLDIGSIIVHLFKPETRAFYSLESMY